MRPERATAMTRLASSGVMLWRRIADDLERLIATGELVAGEKMPGELQIAERFGVNRHTVRRALADLAERGLVRAERGSGTFVESDRLAYPISARTRFSEIVGAAGHEAGGRLIADATEPADHHIARRLAVAVGTPVIRLDFVRSVDRVPVSSGTTWLPAERFPDAACTYRKTRSMTRTLAHAGVNDYVRYSTRISAAVADAVDAARLGLAPGRALIVVDSVDVETGGRPVLTTRARFAADRIELVVES